MSRSIMILLFLTMSASQGMAQATGETVETPPAEAVLEPILWSTVGSLLATGLGLAATGSDFEIDAWPAPLSDGTIPVVEAGAVAGTMAGGYAGARIRGHKSPGVASAISSAVAVYGLSLVLRDAENTMGSAPAILLFSIGEGTAAVLGPAAWRWVARQF